MIDGPAFATELARCAERATVGKSPLALLSVRIDAFAEIERDHGGAVARSMLDEVGRLAAGAFDDAPAIARLGSERVGVLVESDLADARRAADTLRRIVAATPLIVHPAILATVSVGVAPFVVHEGAAALVRASCAAMEAAARAGGNRVV